MREATRFITDEPLHQHDDLAVTREMGLRLQTIPLPGDGSFYEIRLSRADGRELRLPRERFQEFEDELDRPLEPTISLVIDRLAEICAHEPRRAGSVRRFLGDEAETLLGA